MQEGKLAVLQLIAGKRETIFNNVNTAFYKHKLWPSTKMVLSDTTSENIVRYLGMVTRLLKPFEVIGQKYLHSFDVKTIF